MTETLYYKAKKFLMKYKTSKSAHVYCVDKFKFSIFTF